MIRRLLYTMDPEEDGEKEEYFTSIRVQNPTTEQAENGEKYTSYEIMLESNDIAFTLPLSCVRRRFSDFLWLRKQLSDNEPEISPPELPSKSFLRSRFNNSLIRSRQQKLQEFLESVIKVPAFLGDSSLHLFLQTPLSIAEMEECLQGHNRMNVLDTVLEYGNARLYANSFGNDSGLELSGNSHTCTINDSQRRLQQVTGPQCIFSPTRPRSPPLFFRNCEHSTPTETSNSVSHALIHKPSPVVASGPMPGFGGTPPRSLNQIQSSTGVCSQQSGKEHAAFCENLNPRTSLCSDTESAQDSDDPGETPQPGPASKGDEAKLLQRKSDQAYGSLDTLLSPVPVDETNSGSCASTASLERAMIKGIKGSSNMSKSSRHVTFCNEVTVARVIDKFATKTGNIPASDGQRTSSTE